METSGVSQEVLLNHYTWLASQGQSHQDCIKWFNITAAYHFNIITIKAHSASINRDWSDARLSPTTGKSQLWWRAFEQPRSTENPKQSHTWWQAGPILLMVLATTERGDISRPVATNPFCVQCKACPQGCPSLPCPLSLERTTLLHSVILWLLWPGAVFCLATLHLEESKAAEMCTTDGRNYLAHLTSEIYFFSFFFSLSLFHKLLQDWEIDRFLVQVGFWVVHGRPLVFSAIPIVISI